MKPGYPVIQSGLVIAHANLREDYNRSKALSVQIYKNSMWIVGSSIDVPDWPWGSGGADGKWAGPFTQGARFGLFYYSESRIQWISKCWRSERNTIVFQWILSFWLIKWTMFSLKELLSIQFQYPHTCVIGDSGGLCCCAWFHHFDFSPVITFTHGVERKRRAILRQRMLAASMVAYRARNGQTTEVKLPLTSSMQLWCWHGSVEGWCPPHVVRLFPLVWSGLSGGRHPHPGRKAMGSPLRRQRFDGGNEGQRSWRAPTCLGSIVALSFQACLLWVFLIPTIMSSVWYVLRGAATPAGCFRGEVVVLDVLVPCNLKCSFGLSGEWFYRSTLLIEWRPSILGKRADAFFSGGDIWHYDSVSPTGTKRWQDISPMACLPSRYCLSALV